MALVEISHQIKSMDRVHVSILLAEDDADDAFITQRVLDEISEYRFHVDWVSTYEAAAEQVCDNQHDLYLFDYGLGAQSGLDLLKLARQRGCVVPVIMLTGHAGNEMILRAIHAGVADYLVKGQYDAQVLSRSVRYSLERKRTEAVLRVSEERYRNLIGYTSDAVFSYDWQGRMTEVNPAMERMTGYTREALLTLALPSLLTSDSWAVLEDSNIRQMAGERTSACEVAIRAKSGALIPIELTSTLITDGHRPVEFQAIGRALVKN